MHSEPRILRKARLHNSTSFVNSCLQTKKAESKASSNCSVQGERSHMFLISPLTEQGEVMMKSSLSSGQVQIVGTGRMLNTFRHTCLFCGILHNGNRSKKKSGWVIHMSSFTFQLIG